MRCSWIGCFVLHYIGPGGLYSPRALIRALLGSLVVIIEVHGHAIEWLSSECRFIIFIECAFAIEPRFGPFHGHVLCLCLLVSLPFHLVSSLSEDLFELQNAPFHLENSHDVAQGCGCAVGLREIRHPSDRKYWVYFLLPCFLRWRVILLYCLGCVGSHRCKIWMVHCFLGR